jgi:radical SAM superfamily enzyme YgiQ (UPF0313 family)
MKSRTMPPSLLLINPWIYDFAAYDFFARPLGLLYLAGALRARGFTVHLVDCLGTPPARSGPFGTGHYPKEILPNPPPLQKIPRRYGRYGLRLDEFRAQLARVPAPAAILVTSLMTYWYPGVMEAIRLARQHFPQTPVILGGIYATLCPEHARRHSGADLVAPGPGEGNILNRLAEVCGAGEKGGGEALRLAGAGPSPALDMNSLPYPALDLLPSLTFIPILTSRGCPFSCAYCASRQLQPAYRPRPPLAVVAELAHWQERLGLAEAVFYDDALLVDPERHLLVILEEAARRGLKFRFHTPNGLHARFISREVAHWLKRAGFATLRLGVETTVPEATRLDSKLTAGELEAALAHLKEAGFGRKELGVYLLMGLPGQPEEEIAASIRRIKALGATPVLTQYSPIPGTALWTEAVACSRYDLAAEPLCHNNSLFPCLARFSWEPYTRLKRLAAA